MASLCLGAIIYLLFRQNTYLHTLLRVHPTELSSAVFIGADILRYFVPDFLWSYSLCSGLYAIVLPKGWMDIGLPMYATMLGLFWECLQWFHCVSGTGDVLDILSYGLAASVVIYIKKRK